MFRRIYPQKKFFNPFYPKNIHRRKSLKNIFLIIFGFIILGFALVYLSPLFVINDFEFRGLTQITEGEIRKIVQNNISRWDRLLIFNINHLQQKLLENKFIKTAEIIKKLPNKLIITVGEREPFGLIQSGEKYFIFDRDGVILREINSDEKPNFNLPNFINENQSVDQDSRINPKTIDIFQIARNILRDRLNVVITNISLPTLDGELIKITTNEGWQIYFDINSDLTQQITKLETILKKIISNRNNLQYIDLRFEDRVYYK